MADRNTSTTSTTKIKTKTSFRQLLVSASTEKTPKVRTLGAGSKTGEFGALGQEVSARVFRDAFGNPDPMSELQSALWSVDVRMTSIKISDNDEPSCFDQLVVNLKQAKQDKSVLRTGLDGLMQHVVGKAETLETEKQKAAGVLLSRTFACLIKVYDALDTSPTELEKYRTLAKNTLLALDQYLSPETVTEPVYVSRTAEKTEKSEKKEKKEKKIKQLKSSVGDPGITSPTTPVSVDKKAYKEAVKQAEKDAEKAEKDAEKARKKQEKEAKAAQADEKAERKAQEKAALKAQRRSMKFNATDLPSTPRSAAAETVQAPLSPRSANHSAVQVSTPVPSGVNGLSANMEAMSLQPGVGNAPVYQTPVFTEPTATSQPVQMVPVQTVQMVPMHVVQMVPVHTVQMMPMNSAPMNTVAMPQYVAPQYSQTGVQAHAQPGMGYSQIGNYQQAYQQAQLVQQPQFGQAPQPAYQLGQQPGSPYQQF